MKKHVLSAAIAAASLAGFSGASMAWNIGTTPDMEVFMSGATAMDNSIKNMFENLCDPGTLDFYRNGSDPDPDRVGSAYSAYFCTLSPSKVPNLSASKRVLFIKRSAGGSAQGVNPLIDGAQLDALNIFGSNVCQPFKANASGAMTWNCNIGTPNALVKKYPNIGISDVDPLLFRGPNTPAGFNAVTPAGAQQLEVRAVVALIFGIPVTKTLYNALQIVQIDRGELPDTCAVGDYNETCMPSLSKQQVATLITGRIKNWDEFKFVASDGQTYPFTQYPGIPSLIQAREAFTNKPFNNFVHFCKRVAGSGTGAQQYAKFLNNPCTAGALAPSELDDQFDGPRVLINSGSGNVDSCLNDFETGDNQGRNVDGTVQNEDIFTGDSYISWAIGVQSLEKNANDVLGFRFVKIDGVAPTLQNAANGKYMDWVEPTYQWRKSGNGAPTGDTLRIIEKLVVDAGNPVTVGNILNKTSTYPFGKSGYLAVATNGHDYSHILDEFAPVIGYSHAAVGALNNCAVPVIPVSDADKPL